MQIIFDSEKQKEDLVKLLNGVDGCPSDLGLENNCKEFNGACRVCWKKALDAVEKGRDDVSTR